MTDLVFLHLLAGDGGFGRISFRREKFVAKGGPDGGDGGSGGNLIIKGNAALNTLKQYAGKTAFKAEQGHSGGKKNQAGAKGTDLVLEVPIGTIIWQLSENQAAHHRRLSVGGVNQSLSRNNIKRERYQVMKEGEFVPERPADDLFDPEKFDEIKKAPKFDPEQFELIKLAEVLKDGQTALICQGGIGGRGNEQFKGPSLTTPLVAEYGSFGEQRLVALELKLLADIGLVGFPNAGKSTLIARLTSARPKIAAYPFTTMEPHLGLYQNPKTGKELVIADIPGLIEGAGQGKGLGFQFLRHIENCSTLVYVLALEESVALDAEVSDDKKAEQLWQQYQALVKELSEFSQKLKTKDAHLLLNKIDICPPTFVTAATKRFAKEGLKITPISAVTGTGIETLHNLLAQY
ncbi:MAG: GTPase ObgE [Candidatus Pacebacteria bacterium CG10_big_fil_rev_8_21_14_0_10_44_11]|nr:MAG: GTPase ObgE [Candidatus Pacebacteria bacterium CG10_big_fil_rev_8_21_14_0_10_44_11]